MTSEQPGRGQGLTTEQIAAAGAGAGEKPGDTPPEMRTDTAVARPLAAGDGHNGHEARTPLLGQDELRGMTARWQEIQAGFVDEPRRAVRDADELVAQLMQRLAEMFAAERRHLEAQWVSGEQVDTEDLRQGLQRYRSFFERLLAI